MEKHPHHDSDEHRHHSEHNHPEMPPIDVFIILPEEMGPYKRDHLWEIIKTQAETIGRLTKIVDEDRHHKKHHEKGARYLAISKIEGEIKSVSFNILNKHQITMSVSFKAAGGATATLKGFASDGITDATSDIDRSSITAVSNHPETFTAEVDATNGLIVHLKGVSDGSGTITYSAKNTAGQTLTLVDSVTVSDTPPVNAATSLGVDYVTF